MISLLGQLVGYFVNAWAWLFRTQSTLLKRLVLIVIVVLAGPPVVQYWMSRVHMPAVPISAIIETAIATLFMVAFGGSMYVLIGFLNQLTVSQRIGSYAIPKGQLQAMKPTDGAFIPTDDEKLYDNEMLEKLKKAGILNKTDLEGFASEVGHAQIVKMRGRTE